jgi:S-adenosylmethionine hydrolase
MRPIVAFLSDFGTRDFYVGAVKGAILAACPEATVVDLVHDLPPHDVLEGAFSLAAAVSAFPAGSVFLAVVDPGVGSDRRGLAIAAGGYLFVGPDNGIFTLALSERPATDVRLLSNAGLFRHQVSDTFHGRDVFGPVAGHLARGLPIEEVGPKAEEPVRLPLPEVRRRGEEWEGVVVHADRFGNLVTNFTRSDLEAAVAALDGDPNRLQLLIGEARLPLARTYADLAEGEACVLLGGAGRLELAVNQGSAALRFGAGRGARVRLRGLPSGDGFPPES